MRRMLLRCTCMYTMYTYVFMCIKPCSHNGRTRFIIRLTPCHFRCCHRRAATTATAIVVVGAFSFHFYDKICSVDSFTSSTKQTHIPDRFCHVHTWIHSVLSMCMCVWLCVCVCLAVSVCLCVIVCLCVCSSRSRQSRTLQRINPHTIIRTYTQTQAHTPLC